MNVQQLRKSHLTLSLPASPAVATKLATFIAGHPMRINAAQLALSDSGVGAGATTVLVKINGVAISVSAPLTVAQGAATLATKATVSGVPAGSPSGARVNPNDVITVDLTAVPATIAPKAVHVILSLIELDT